MRHRGEVRMLFCREMEGGEGHYYMITFVNLVMPIVTCRLAFVKTSVHIRCGLREPVFVRGSTNTGTNILEQ